MARRLIIDTGVLIASERSGAPWPSPLADDQVLADDDDLAISAVTAAELFTGVQLAANRHRTARAEFVAKVLATIPIETYDLATAEAHGRLLAFAHRSGARRGAHDLIIAATALATRRTIITTDTNARFADLPGVDCLVVG